MSFDSDKEGDRRVKNGNHSDSEVSARTHPNKKKKLDNPEIGNALRSVYQHTVDEDIPPEMLDLLGKLS